ncbi:MAG: translocation/assembly module TamB domain-containing protein [Paramuribaculum sp.]|nr:translocation/assembly module TamB domain-containing protein [Paramuribaculum sp.]
MKRGIVHTITRITGWLIATILALILLVIILLYMPPVQRWIKDFALEKVNESPDMHVSVDDLRLRFPLDLEVTGVTVTTPVDTMLRAGKASVDIALLPLFTGNIKIRDISLYDALYRSGTLDSATCLEARIDTFFTSDIGTRFSLKRLNISSATLKGADIGLWIKDTVTTSTPDTSVTDMTVIAGKLDLQRVRFHMAMENTIDSIGTYLPATLIGGVKVDMLRHSVSVDSLISDSLSATYLTPAVAVVASAKPDNTVADSVSSTPWSINCGKLALTGNATYARRGAVAAPGLDMDYLQLNGINLQVDSFYNRGSVIRVPVSLSATERCGLSLRAKADFAMDSTVMRADSIMIATDASLINAAFMMGLGDLSSNPDLPVRLQAYGYIGMPDIRTAYPTTGKILADLPRYGILELQADIDGTSGYLNIADLSAKMPGVMSLKADGNIANVADFNSMTGKINLTGRLNEGHYLAALLPASLRKDVKIPSSRIDGFADFSPAKIAGDITLHTAEGRLAAQGKWLRRTEGYSASLDISDFPVARFLPTLGIDDVSLIADAEGSGFDISSVKTHADVNATLQKISYNGIHLTDITLNARLDSCKLVAELNSPTKPADMTMHVTADILKEGYGWDITSDIRHLDLAALKLSESPLWGTMQLNTDGTFNTATNDIDARLSADNLRWTVGTDAISARRIDASLLSTDSLMHANLNSGDFSIDALSLCPLDTLLAGISAATDTLDAQIAAKDFDIRPLQRVLPHMTVSMKAGNNNPIANYLNQNAEISYKNLSMNMHNDSIITMQFNIDGFATGQTRIDNFSFDAHQHNQFLVYSARIDNKPGTMDDFAHVSLAGYISRSRFSAMFKQSDISDRQGFLLGMNATMSDSVISVKFVPYAPTIAYKKWKINHDNFASFNFIDNHFDANVHLQSDSSYINLYTAHQPDTAAIHAQEDVILQLSNIKLSEWLSISPFSPPIKGVLDSDMRFRWDKEGITGNGTVDVTNLYYGRERVGTFQLGMNIHNDSRIGALRADMDLIVDGAKVITASGALNDSTARNPFLLDFSMIHFPLRVVNPFLPKSVAQMSGMLNGQMDITGTPARPIFNGYIDFDSTAVHLGLTGADYRFSTVKIPVDSNIVHFKDFTIAGLNKNNLHINGTVDARSLSNILIDLNLNASDMQIVNTSRPRNGANVYGKAFVDLDATAKGSMRFLDVNATVDILSGTNVTYVMSDAESALTSRKNNDMVHFVQFSDTTAVMDADTLATSSMAMMLNANLIISEGSTINVDLSTNGKNKVSLQSTANLTYTQPPVGDARLTGRININNGFVRYSPPFMSEKNFSFSEGSYVAFNGSMLNPMLNIKAVEKLRANVTQEGQNSRLVNFDIILSLTNSLQNVDVKFDLATNDDITVQNELSSMSPEQRANQAMNLLLYNVYTGPGTKGDANLSGNPLFSFLESQINTWAANNIRGVDISFGIDQYKTNTDGTSGTTTSYSYRVSKSLFNDRFKIVVGGNYSTDADADENFSQNLINDISFEYMLNRSGSMYVRLFRHVGYESILEGEITQTGAGFVLKRKLNNLRDIFRFGKPATNPKQ